MFLYKEGQENGPWASTIVCTKDQYAELEKNELVIAGTTDELMHYEDAVEILRDFLSKINCEKKLEFMSKKEILDMLEQEEIANSLDSWLCGQAPDFFEEFHFLGVGDCVMFGFVGKD